MERSVRTTALLVKNYPLGEQHRGLVLLTPDLGVVRAAAFGSRNPKGKLAAVSFPFRHLEVWLYHQPSHDSWKLSDAQELDGFEPIRGNITRFYAASLWAETALLSHLGGDPAASYRLLLEGLFLLQGWPETSVRALNLHFCLRWLAFLGVPWEKGSESGSSESNTDPSIMIDGDTCAWLETAGGLPLGESEPPRSESLAEQLVFQRLREVLGRELLTLRGWALVMPSGR